MGWDLESETFYWMECLHLDKCLLEQQNTKKLKGTKNNRMHCSQGNYE